MKKKEKARNCRFGWKINSWALAKWNSIAGLDVEFHLAEICCASIVFAHIGAPNMDEHCCQRTTKWGHCSFLHSLIDSIICEFVDRSVNQSINQSIDWTIAHSRWFVSCKERKQINHECSIKLATFPRIILHRTSSLLIGLSTIPIQEKLMQKFLCTINIQSIKSSINLNQFRKFSRARLRCNSVNHWLNLSVNSWLARKKESLLNWPIKWANQSNNREAKLIHALQELDHWSNNQTKL